jgi:putative oxidoreductase
MDIGLLLIRVVVGALLAGHGTQKLFGWFSGPGLGGTAEFFASLGYRRPRAMAAVAGFTELAAGLGLATGVAMPLVAAAVVGVMVNAIAVHAHAGLWSQNHGYEYPLVLAVLAVALAWTGPGALSVFGALGIELSGAVCALGAAVVGTLSALVVLATRQRHPTVETTEQINA